MKIVVLGSGAGGGYPQWNCRCHICELYWKGDPRVARRTQSSIAVSGDGGQWVLFNCSPDLREQIARNKVLWPTGLRNSPISGVVLTNGDVDHIGGLLSLRELARFEIFATGDILRILASNSVFDVLAEKSVTRRATRPGQPFGLPGGIEAELFEVPGKVPLFLEGDAPRTAERTGNTVGIAFGRPGAQKALYIPGCAAIDETLAERLRQADLVMFDGTVWSDREMAEAGVGEKTGRRMGHLPVGDHDGSLKRLAALGVPRVIFIHLNNTNPMLVAGSPQRLEIEATGFEIGEDGMEIAL